MGRKTVIAGFAAVLLAATLVVGALLYDRSQQGKIADGVTIEGVDVGGMDADEAEAKVRRVLLRPLDRPLRTVYRERSWAMPAAKLKLRADVGAAVDKALDLARLRERRGDAVDELSGGMRRRLLLARGLVHEPKLILLDEPTVGLDPQIRTELWTLIDNLRSRGTTILMSTHYIEEAERLADEVAVVNKGKVIARATPAELIAAHAGTHTAEVYGPPQRLTEVRAIAEEQGLPVRPAGPAIAIVGSERAADGAVPEDAVVRAASLEDVFVLLTGAEAE